MTASTQEELRERVGRSAGQDAAWQEFDVVEDQMAALEEDVAKIRSHPLIPHSVKVGGFLYDVDTGRLERML
jgi:carbonic anhydrase